MKRFQSIFLITLVFVIATCSKPESDVAPSPPKPMDSDVRIGDTPPAATVGDLSVTVIAMEKNSKPTTQLTYEEIKPLLDNNCTVCHSNSMIDLSTYPAKYDQEMYENNENFYQIAKFRSIVSYDDPNQGELAMPPKESEIVMPVADRAKLASWFAQNTNAKAEATLPKVAKVTVIIGDKTLTAEEFKFSLSEDKNKLLTSFKLLNFDSKTTADGKLIFADATGIELETRTFKIDPKGKLEGLTITVM